MQAVTADFLTAIEATERQIKAKAEIVFLDNSMLGVTPTYSASSTLDATITPASLAFNGKTAPQENFGWVGSDSFPSSSVYPCKSDGTSEVGWWSNVLSGQFISDTFTRANSPTSIGTADTGQVWANTLGTWGISGNAAYIAAVDGASWAQVATVDSGLTDTYTIECDMTTPFTDFAGSIVFRCVDADNQWKASLVRIDLTQRVEIGLMLAGNWSVPAYYDMALDYNTTYHIKVTLTGNHFQMWVDNVLVIDTTIASSLNAATRVGLGLHKDYGAAYYVFDNFECYPTAYTFTPTQTLAVDYTTAQTIKTVKVYGDPRFGYPVDFSVDYATVASPGGADWIAITSVTGNTLTEWSYTLPATISARHLRLSITKWSIANKRAKIIEFEGGYTVIVTGDIVSASITKERNATDESSTLPIGNCSANEIDLKLDNTTGYFYRRNTTSPYYGYIKQNRKIRFWLGVQLPDNSIEYLPQGTYYTTGWNASRTSPEVSVKAQDKAKLMLEKDFARSIVYENYTLSELAELLAGEFGLSSGEYVIDATTETMPYAYFEKDKYWNHFGKLADGETGSAYFDEQDKLIFENRYHLFSTRLSSAASAGDNHIHVDAPYGLAVGDTIYISDNTNTETKIVNSSWDGSATNIPLTTTLTNSYVVDSYVYKNPVIATLSDTSILTEDDDLFDLEKARNKIEVKAKPLIVPLDGLGQPVITTIWQLDEPLTIPAQSYQDIDIFFSDSPVINNATYSVDITVTTDPEGDSAYITTAWQPSVPYAWGGHLRISNSHTSDVEVVGCLIEGVVLNDEGGFIEKAENTVLQAEQGERVHTIESPYIQRKAHALAIANNLLAKWQDPGAAQSCKGRGLPHLQLGDRVKLTDTELGITDTNLNNHFHITRIVLDYDGGLEATCDLLAA